MDIPGVGVEVVVQPGGHGGGLGSVDDIHQLTRRLIVNILTITVLSPTSSDGPAKQPKKLVKNPNQKLCNL